MPAPLDNEVVFKKAFTDKIVFTTFVHDIVGIDIEVDKIETEKKFAPKVGNIGFGYDMDLNLENEGIKKVIDMIDTEKLKTDQYIYKDRKFYRKDYQ